MKTTYYFYDKPIIEKNRLFHVKTDWIAPNPENQNLLAYFSLTQNEINRLKENITLLNLTQNLNFCEKHALKKLKQTEKIVVKKADKGSSIVILDENEYIRKVYDHLNDTTAYQIQKNMSNYVDAKKYINSFLEQILMSYHIDEQIFNYMKPPENPKLSQFYILPKIHKPHIPGRPIVSSINSLTQNISKFLSLCIQPLVPKLKSYVKDTKHFLKKVLLAFFKPRRSGSSFLITRSINLNYVSNVSLLNVTIHEFNDL